MNYRLSSRAFNDLQKVLLYGIQEFGELKALRYQESFRRNFEVLAYMPMIGRKCGSSTPDERRFVHGVHVIYYMIDLENDEIVIQRILHGSTINDSFDDI